MTVWAYYRVSTDLQDYESQKIGVVEYCNRCGYTIDKEIIDDGVSGTVKAKDRNLWKIVKQAKAGDLLITSELSRLGRSTSDVLNTCDIFNKKGVNVWFVKQGMGLDQTPMGKMMVAILSAFAEMERDLIAQRTAEGLRRAKEKGVVLGRKKGGRNKSLKLDKHKNKIVKMFSEGKLQNYVCKRIKCDIKTLCEYCRLNNIIIPKRKPIDMYQETIIKMRVAGKSYSKIGEIIGFSGPAVSKYCIDNEIIYCREVNKPRDIEERARKREEREQKRLKIIERKKAKEKRIKRLEKLKNKAKTQTIKQIWMF